MWGSRGQRAEPGEMEVLAVQRLREAEAVKAAEGESHPPFPPHVVVSPNRALCRVSERAMPQDGRRNDTTEG